MDRTIERSIKAIKIGFRYSSNWRHYYYGLTSTNQSTELAQKIWFDLLPYHYFRYHGKVHLSAGYNGEDWQNLVRGDKCQAIKMGSTIYSAPTLYYHVSSTELSKNAICMVNVGKCYLSSYWVYGTKDANYLKAIYVRHV